MLRILSTPNIIKGSPCVPTFNLPRLEFSDTKLIKVLENSVYVTKFGHELAAAMVGDQQLPVAMVYSAWAPTATIPSRHFATLHPWIYAQYPQFFLLVLEQNCFIHLLGLLVKFATSRIHRALHCAPLLATTSFSPIFSTDRQRSRNE
jgi:hypothetical protein